MGRRKGRERRGKEGGKLVWILPRVPHSSQSCGSPLATSLLEYSTHLSQGSLLLFLFCIEEIYFIYSFLMLEERIKHPKLCRLQFIFLFYYKLFLIFLRDLITFYIQIFKFLPQLLVVFLKLFSVFLTNIQVVVLKEEPLPK